MKKVINVCRWFFYMWALLVLFTGTKILGWECNQFEELLWDLLFAVCFGAVGGIFDYIYHRLAKKQKSSQTDNIKENEN